MDTVLFSKWKRTIGKLMSFAPHLFCICGSGHATAAVLLLGFAISLWQSHAGSRTAAVLWPDPYVFTVYMTHILSVYILYGHTNDALILATSYLHIHFSYVHECILTALYCAVLVYSCMCFYDCLYNYHCTLSEITRIKMINQSMYRNH